MAGKKGQKKWLWSDDEKRLICAQTLTPGVSVAQGIVAELRLEP
jgi:transposase